MHKNGNIETVTECIITNQTIETNLPWSIKFVGHKTNLWRLKGSLLHSRFNLNRYRTYSQFSKDGFVNSSKCQL